MLNVNRVYGVSVNMIMSVHVNYIGMLNSHGCACIYMHDLYENEISMSACMPELYCVLRLFAVNACF